MKYFCISDIHGAYDSLINAMLKCGYDERNPNHQLIVLGDYFGRASIEPGDNVLVYEWLTADLHVNKPICIKGNHELIIEKMFRRNTVSYTDMYNGEHVRFDDDRLKETLKLLKQSGEHRQVLLFTCQSREQKIMEELS